VRGILREVRDGAYAVPEDAVFELHFADPQGRRLASQEVRLSPFGTFDAALELPAGAALGAYVIGARQERKGREALEFQGGFEVREFKLEKIKLALEFPRRVWFRGETISAGLSAAYYWGEPLAGRLVRCTLPDGRTLNLTTDKAGKASFEFDTSGFSPGRPLPFLAAIDGENVEARESLTLARLGFTIKAQPSQEVIIAGEAVDLSVETRAADGRPCGEALALEVLRVERPKPAPILALLPWPQLPEPEAAEALESRHELKTDPATGKASLTLKLEHGGRYRLRLTGTDRFGQAVTGATEVQVSDAGDANKLRWFADGSSLKAGIPAKVRLHSRLERGLALVTWEGETILHHRIVELRRDANELEFPVGHELFPNFRLAAAALDGRTLQEAAKEFTVERELKVALKPLQEAFPPGGEGRFEIAVTDQTGAPVAAELSLALVNEALFGVCPDTTTPILEFFQKDARRHAGFHTAASNSFRYPGITRAVSRDVVDDIARLARAGEEIDRLLEARREVDQLMVPQAAAAPADVQLEFADGFAQTSGLIYGRLRGAAGGQQAGQVPQEDSQLQGRNGDAGGAAARPEPRREDRAAGVWLPSVVTGADGRALASFRMPETTTAWRLTARGCTVETLVGQALATTLTQKDFFVDLKAPSFVREGDQLRVVGRVHNRTGWAGPVALGLRVRDAANPAALLAERERAVEVAAHGGAEVVFDAFTVPDADSLTIEISGRGGDHADALALTVPVRAWGLPYVVHAGGSATADAAAVLELPAGRPYSALRMGVAIGPDVQTAVLDMALRAHGPGRMPVSWGAHPANELLAFATALAYANAAPGQARDTHAPRLAAAARAQVAALVAMQAKDGSWAGDLLGPFATARAFWALVAARDAAIAVPQPVLDLAAAHLLKQLAGFDANDNDSKAIVLHALSTDKRADFAACNRLYRDRNSLGNTTLAYLTRAFFNIDRKEIAAELAGILEAKAKAEPGQPVVWESGYKAAWLNDTVGNHALVLLALAESLPDSPRAGAAAQACCRPMAASASRPAAPAGRRGRAGRLVRPRPRTIDRPRNRRAGEWQGSRHVKSGGANGLTLLLEVPADAQGRQEPGRVQDARPRPLHLCRDPQRLLSPTPSPPATRSAPASIGSTCTPSSNTAANPSRQQHLAGQNSKTASGQRAPARPPRPHIQRPLVRARHPAAGRHPPGRGLAGNQRQPAPRNPRHLHPGLFQQPLPPVKYDLTGYVPGKFRLLPCTCPRDRQPGLPRRRPGPGTHRAGTRREVARSLRDEHRRALRPRPMPFRRWRRRQRPRVPHRRVQGGTRSSTKANSRACCCGSTPSRSSTTPAGSSRCSKSSRERYPTLEIPFDRILVVGKAYSDIGEHERAWLVYRAVIAASFANDSGISAVLEDEGRFLGSIDLPGTGLARIPRHRRRRRRHFALSQALYQKGAESRTNCPGGRGATGENRDAQAHAGPAAGLPRPLSRRPARRRRRLQPVQRAARPEGTIRGLSSSAASSPAATPKSELAPGSNT
jgi:alpha-2-macroglobulin